MSQGWSAARREKFYKKLPPELVEGKWSEELEAQAKAYSPAPRTTVDEEDVRSLNRKLDTFLFLVVKGSDGRWRFPEAPHQDGETMRNTAERALHETVGDALVTYTIGNAPMAHFRRAEAGTASATEGEDGDTGAGGSGGDAEGTLFHYKMSLLEAEGDLRRGGSAEDFAWLTKEEIVQDEYLGDQKDLLQVIL
mmetsp:Transcript_31378/g.102337  ORF Transcript_31378/g.102337 Transcript_31378/m.102337 type:complete len:194 (+) Transcript_31378:29-610(+)